MSVHYKFKSALSYDTVTFDGLHISVKDLKNAIIQQKRIGKSADFDLQVTNAETSEVYVDDNALIQKNTSLLIARVPVSSQNRVKQWEGYGGDNTPPTKLDDGGPIGKRADLSSLDAPEDDKITAMMSQSTQDYDPSNYMKIRGANQMGAVPPSYRCYKCHQTGHWIKDCPLGAGADPLEIKKSTGIPRSFMVKVDGPQVPGAMMTPNGQYAVPALDMQAYNQKGPSTMIPPPVDAKMDIPEDLVCSLCLDLLSDAVMIPCCGNSFCDECIRGVLLESEEHECPDCHEKEISPGTLIPNRFLRNSVLNFKNTTGYVKKFFYKPKFEAKPPIVEETKLSSEMEEKTVISEADSTEQSAKRIEEELAQKTENSVISTPSNESLVEPPGTSPRRDSPKKSVRSKVVSNFRENNKVIKTEGRDRSLSPKRRSRHNYDYESNNSSSRATSQHHSSHSLNFTEERSNTPTVDEPNAANGATNPPPGDLYQQPFPNNGPPPQNLNPMGPIQVPPPNMQFPQQPPGTYGPPQQAPNFGLPPPGANMPPFNPMPFGGPPRGPPPMFDAQNRPPMAGPPPQFGGSYPPRGPRPDFRSGGRMPSVRPPPGVIDDPLAAFNRMLREKDERERRKRMRNRSYSRSRSRSRSYSRSPSVGSPVGGRRRRISRTPPPRRRSRSRSRSFSMSRSRSRTYSGGYKSPPPSRRSPPPPLYSAPPRRANSRLRSPPPAPRRRVDRDFDNYNRRDEGRPYNKGGDRGRRSRSRDRYYDRPPSRGEYAPVNDRRGDGPPPHRGGGGGYYPPPQENYNNRYPPNNPRGDYQPPPMGGPMQPMGGHMGVPMQQMGGPMQQIQPMGGPIPSLMQRRFDDIAPPGVEEPPIPGLEDHSPSSTSFDRYGNAPNPNKPEEKEKTPVKNKSPEKHERERDRDRNRERDRDRDRDRDRSSRKKRNRDDSEDRKHSEDDRKKSKDKKKKKERRESEKKKKHDKKDKKHRKKDEFKQVIVKNTSDNESEEKKAKTERIKEKSLTPKKLQSPERLPPLETTSTTPKKLDLYEDINSTAEIDASILENYVRDDFIEPEPHIQEEEAEEPNLIDEELAKHEESGVQTEEEEGEIKEELPVENKRVMDANEDSEGERDFLELHSNDIVDLKTELDKGDDFPVPERSKWEQEDEFSSSERRDYSPSNTDDLSGKMVTNEVLKRAENAIFAKAINAIRPIEIKKISGDRIKLYSGEEESKASETTPTQVQMVEKVEHTGPQPAKRVSVKDRLGIKVQDDPKDNSKDFRAVRGGRNRSRSPFGGGASVSRRRGYDSRRDGERSRDRRSDDRGKMDRRREESRRSRSRDRRRRRSRTPSKKETSKRHKRSHEKESKEKASDHRRSSLEKAPIKATLKRKATIDEASFEPDYDLESEEEKKSAKKQETKEKKPSSSEDSDSSSSDEEVRKKKKHKKRSKKKKRRESSSSSSSSSSESDSSEDEKHSRRNKKHKKKSKKRKKSKHK